MKFDRLLYKDDSAKEDSEWAEDMCTKIFPDCQNITWSVFGKMHLSKKTYTFLYDVLVQTD